jgi:hypothetical protein|nr:MAG TPA: hypothetical protein [Caudoviricetes sp.]
MLLFFICYIIFAFFVCLIAGPAALLALAILSAFVYEFAREWNQMKTSQGRQQIHKEIQREKKIEKYWGTIDYWEDK